MSRKEHAKRGWHWDEANSRLGVMVNGVEAGYFTTAGAYITVAGTGEVTFGSDATYPTTSDSNALGTTSNMWSDLFLASGGVINFNNGAVTMTHSGQTVTLLSTWATAAATGRPFLVQLTTNVSLGSYANAFKAYVNCSSVGGATGLLSAGNFEITFPTTGIAGTTVGVEIELTYGATCGALQKPAFFYFGTNGTARTDFDTYGDFFKLSTNVTAGAGKFLSANSLTLRCGTGALSATKRYLVMSENENSIYLGSSTTPVPTAAGSCVIRVYGDIQSSASSGGSTDCIYAHQYVSPTVDVTSGAYVFASHFRLEIQGGATTSVTSMSAAVRAYYMTDGTSSVSLDGTCATIYAECRIGNNTTVAATGNFAVLNLVSRCHASAVFTGEAQYWAIVVGRISASYQTFRAAMRVTGCQYLLDVDDDDAMCDDDDTNNTGTKSGYIRVRFRDAGTDRYIWLYDSAGT